ncbi:MAG TPA: hypothetical protein VGR35_02430 [Tepidisphaeraceae bacterium]|nr:hypothetical protein [Tepidisphaeraceae bacterium]
MFPLAGKNFPTSSDELATSIEEALGEVFAMPKRSGVTVDGAKFPALKTVKINLTGATISAKEPPPKPKPTGKRQPGVRVEKLEVTGQPIQYEQTKLNLKVAGSGLAFDFARDKKGKPLLVLAEAEDGKVEAKISRKDIETLLTEAAGLAAKQQGIRIQDLDLDLEQEGPRSVAAEVRVKAKKLMMSGTIVITGKLEIDDELNATVLDLNCTGEGMVGALAAGVVQAKMRPYNGMTIPLMTFSLGDVALRDLKIKVKDSVEISAAFGKEA